jgi:glycerol uptake facilitator-like aquaporin
MLGYMERVKKDVSLKLLRDAAAELIGTFMLVSAQCALPLTWGRPGHFDHALITGVGMGFVVTTMAEAVGVYSGGHFNPAVSISMAVCLKITVLKGESLQL